MVAKEPERCYVTLKLLVEVDDKLPEETQTMVRESINMMLGVKSCEDFKDDKIVLTDKYTMEETETTVERIPQYGVQYMQPLPNEVLGKVVLGETPKPSFFRRWIGPGLILVVAIATLIISRM